EPFPMPNCMFVVTLPKQLDSDLDPTHLLDDDDDGVNSAAANNAATSAGENNNEFDGEVNSSDAVKNAVS
ncbi:hypothetical protein BOX15_Mlig001016g9, partial [Macrostomum lignano]